MNSNIHPFKALLTVSLIVFSLSVFAQTTEDTRWLILKTQPEDTPIELIGSLRIDTDGNMEATPVNPEACSGDGELSCDDLNVVVDPPTLRVNGTTSVTVDEGQSLAFSWNSRGAWSCDADGSGSTLPGWNTRTDLPPNSADATSSQRTVSTAGLASPTAYQANLECSNGPVFIDETVSVTVNESDIQLPESCDDPGRQPPANWTRLSTGSLTCVRNNNATWNTSANCEFYDQVWPGSFVETTGVSRRLGLRTSSARDYIAMQFNTNGLPTNASGAIGIDSPGTGLTSRRKIMSISKCPGDFNYDAIMAETGCIAAVFNFSFNWGGSSTLQSCKLDSNEPYFLNIVHTDTPLEPGMTSQDLEAHPDCAESGTTCGNVYNPARFD